MRGVTADRHDAMLGQADAAARLRQAKQRLGPGGWALAFACIIEDAPWHMTARRLGVSAIEVKQATASAIRRLSG